MEFIKKHPTALRYISILAIISLIFPTFFIGNYCGDGGKYFALAIYAFIAILGSYEVLKNLNVSKPMALLVSLTTLVIFFFPKETFLIDNIVPQSSGRLPATIKFAINWKALLIIGLAPLVLLIDQNIWKSPSKIIYQLLIASSTMLLISIFAKFIWIVNIVDYVQLFYFIPIAIVADSFGYFGGKYFRKYIFNGKKLAPKLSPKKTWAGFIIGYILSALFVGLVGWAMGIFDSFDNPILILVMMTIILPIISPLGDLFFSGVKRFLGIKDFSNLMPGHGGIMDRIDAMSWVIFILFITFALTL